MLALIAGNANATWREGYYDGMNGKKKEALKSAAKACVQSHQMLPYYELPTYWQYSDVYPELVDGSRRWWEMYSNNTYLIRSNQSALSSFSSNKMQREHAVPKSWWKYGGSVEYTPAYSDMWNLYPSDAQANGAKLNYPFGETDKPVFNNGCSKVGPPVPGQGGGSGYVFEPADEYKGDFARTCFYMATVYDDIHWTYSYMFTGSAYPTLITWARETLLDWARQDPVSQKEIDRNNAVEVSQGNRNPFIDFPELAEYIWGTRMSETFYVADQSGEIIVPPVTGEPEIYLPVNGESLDFGQAAVGTTKNVPLEIQGKNLTSPLSVRIVGTDKDLFSVPTSTIPAININVGNTYLLNIAYSPKTTGNHSARLLLYDGGLPDGQNIAVTLKAEALPAPTLSTLTANQAENVTSTGYTASWSTAPEVIDYYLFSRTRYNDYEESSEEMEVNGTSIVIDDATPDTKETYKVRSSRLGFISPWSNTVNVTLATAGIGNQQTAADPLIIGAVTGGFIILSDHDITGLKVYDMTGRQILVAPEAHTHEIFYLPQGIYIVTADKCPSPRKLLVTGI